MEFATRVYISLTFRVHSLNVKERKRACIAREMRYNESARTETLSLAPSLFRIERKRIVRLQFARCAGAILFLNSRKFAMEKNDSPKNDSPKSDSLAILAQLRERSQKRIEEESVSAFKALADASALAYSEMKRSPNPAQFSYSLSRVKEAFATLRSIAQESNASRSLERTRNRAKRFGIDVELH